MEASDALSMELSTSVKVRVSSTMSLVELREKYFSPNSSWDVSLTIDSSSPTIPGIP